MMFRVRLGYIVKKLMAFIGAISVMYYVIAHHIYPGINRIHVQSFSDALLELLMPFMLGWLIVFFIIFECVANVFAEFTRFADRNFYDDWWNSVSFDEFSRKWNKPVRSIFTMAVLLTDGGRFMNFYSVTSIWRPLTRTKSQRIAQRF
jgi:sterol O-acyltransferase